MTVVPRVFDFRASLDGVLIATPSATHAEIALPYIERGIATFVEKPMVTTIADAEHMRGAAQQSGAFVFVGHTHLYNPAFRALCNLVTALGPIRYILCEGMNGNPGTDLSVLWDWLPHHLSMAMRLFGHEPGSVSARNIDGVSPTQAAVSRFLFGKIPLVCTTSWLSLLKRQNMKIVAEKGTLVFDDTTALKLILYDPAGEVTFPTYESEPPLSVELQAFCNSIRTGEIDRDHLADGTAIVRAIVAAEHSIEAGGRKIFI